MNFIINTDIDPGDLSGLTFYWEYDFELLNPWDWPIFEDLEVFIAKIEVDGLVLQKRFAHLSLSIVYIIPNVSCPLD